MIARRLALSAMVAVLVLPLPWTLLVNLHPEVFGVRIRSAPLIDQGKPVAEPEWSWTSWWSGDFQKAFEPWFAAELEPRGWIIRRVNQIYYSLFHKSYMYEGNIIVGHEEELYERGYLLSYCRPMLSGPPPPPGWVERLARLGRALESRGSALLFLVTPSKAEAMPERIPDGICAREPGERRASRWVAELREQGITVIDAPEIVAGMRKVDPVPPFPRGGVHWSSLVAARVAAMSVDAGSGRIGVDLGTIELAVPRWNEAPSGIDADLASLMNLQRPPLDYAVGRSEVGCRATDRGRGTALIAVGGSFLQPLLEPIGNCGLFRSVEHYFYYDELGHRLFPGPYLPVDRRKLDWGALLAQPSVVLLEVNESIVDVPVPHLEEFLADVERALPSLNEPGRG